MEPARRLRALKWFFEACPALEGTEVCFWRTAKFLLPGRPQTYKPPRHRFGQKHFYCGHRKEIKAARKLLETAWTPRESLTGCAVKLVIRSCGPRRPAFSSPKVSLQERSPATGRAAPRPQGSGHRQPRQVRAGRCSEEDPDRRQASDQPCNPQALVQQEDRPAHRS